MLQPPQLIVKGSTRQLHWRHAEANSRRYQHPWVEEALKSAYRRQLFKQEYHDCPQLPLLVPFPLRGGGNSWGDGSSSPYSSTTRFPGTSEHSFLTLSTSKALDRCLSEKMHLETTLSAELWKMYAENLEREVDIIKRKKRLHCRLQDMLLPIIRQFGSQGAHSRVLGLYIVGSTLTGFGKAESDLDVCLVISMTQIEQRTLAVKVLQETSSLLTESGEFEDITLILAKAPILKFRDVASGIAVDLNCNNFVGLRNTALLHAYGQVDWRVRPLVLAVKLWAAARGINDPKNMTLSSYSISLMVIHYLQVGPKPPILPSLQILDPRTFSSEIDLSVLGLKFSHRWQSRISNPCSLGGLLLGFLDYYANKFPFDEMAISVRLGTALPITACKYVIARKNDPHQWNNLCIEEPFDLCNTAHSVFDSSVFARVLREFARGSKILPETYSFESLLHGDASTVLSPYAQPFQPKHS